MTVVKPVAASDLETRVAHRKRELIAELVEHKKSSRLGAAEAIDQLKARLSDLGRILDGIGDGWANMSHGARRKLDEWVAK